MKTSTTRTFKRFISRHNLPKAQIGNYWRVYRQGGKKAVLSLVNPLVEPIVQAPVHANIFPPSMPKSACDKIAMYHDAREAGGNITIKLKAGFSFEHGFGMASCLNVKEAIFIMRGVKAS